MMYPLKLKEDGLLKEYLRGKHENLIFSNRKRGIGSSSFGLVYFTRTSCIITPLQKHLSLIASCDLNVVGIIFSSDTDEVTPTHSDCP